MYIMSFLQLFETKTNMVLLELLMRRGFLFSASVFVSSELLTANKIEIKIEAMSTDEITKKHKISEQILTLYIPIV